MKNVFAICGSTRKDSSNLQILTAIKELYQNELNIEIFTGLTEFPLFNPDTQSEHTPEIIKEFRSKIQNADGVLICTPEYVHSVPAVLKNAIEWTIATTVFSEKPVALITASGLGQKAHESLCLIMKTIYARFSEETQLCISGARTKVSGNKIVDSATLDKIKLLINSFINSINTSQSLHSPQIL
jgi:Predicted flavoprotein